MDATTGSCRCGKVTLTVSQPPFMTSACHCTGCRKMSASAFSLTAMFPAEALTVDGDTVKGGIAGTPLDHRFCPDCLTWMFTRIEGRDFVNIRPTMFDTAPDWSCPFMETMTAEKLAWARTGAARSFAGFPEPDDMPGLLAAFAARG